MASPSLLVLDDARHVGLTAAELVANRIRARPRARVLLPTGHTPRGLYAALRDHAADGSLPSRHVTVLGLDEYLGLGAEDPRSFRAALDGELAGIAIGRRDALDGAAADPEAEARALPGRARHRRRSTSPSSAWGATRTSPSTSPGRGPATTCAAWHWTRRPSRRPRPTSAARERVPREALTVGLRTLLAARELLLIVTGAEKAEALHAALRGRSGPPRPPRCCAAIRA